MNLRMVRTIKKSQSLDKAEAVDMLTKKYSDGISTMDKIEQQALGMANVMADVIVKQFPMNF